MASLISPELMAQLYLRRSMPGTLAGPSRPQPVGHVQFHAPGSIDPLYFNMADQEQDENGPTVYQPQQGQFMQAHQMRTRGSATSQQGIRGQGPLTAEMQRAKLEHEQLLNQKLQQGKPEKQPLVTADQLNPQQQGTGSVTVRPFETQRVDENGNPMHAMSPEALHQWSQAIQTNNPNAPVTNPADLTAGGQGFTVQHVPQEGFGRMPQAPPQVNPVVQMIQAHKQKFPDSIVDKMAQVPGVTVQQIMSHMQQEQAASQRAAHEKETTQRQDEREAHREQREETRDLTAQEKELQHRAEQEYDPAQRALIEKDLQATRQKIMGNRQQMAGGRGGSKGQGQLQPPAAAPQQGGQIVDAVGNQYYGGRGGTSPTQNGGQSTPDLSKVAPGQIIMWNGIPIRRTAQ